MDIYSKRGTEVIFAFPSNGYTHDQEVAYKHLFVGATYTVEKTHVESFSSSVELQEVPGVEFNTVLFRGIPSPVSKEEE